MTGIASATGLLSMLALAACTAVGTPGRDTVSTVSTDSTEAQQFFLRVAPVFQDRRCLNCHTATGFPRQGDDGHPHIMSVRRGPQHNGAIGLSCATCHQSRNSPAGVPGVDGWRLAPLKMSWEGLPAGEICRSLFDPLRGGMTPDSLAHHLSTDHLVLWAWSPGVDLSGALRRPPKLPHDEFVALTKEWLSKGGLCPP